MKSDQRLVFLQQLPQPVVSPMKDSPTNNSAVVVDVLLISDRVTLGAVALFVSADSNIP